MKIVMSISVVITEDCDVEKVVEKVKLAQSMLCQGEDIPIAAISPSARDSEENELREKYRVTYGKGFRLTIAQKKLVDSGECTTIDVLRAILGGKMDTKAEEPEPENDLPDHGKDDGEYM